MRQDRADIPIGTIWDCTPLAWEQGERPPGWPDGWIPNTDPYGYGVPWPGYRYVGVAREEGTAE